MDEWLVPEGVTAVCSWGIARYYHTNTIAILLLSQLLLQFTTSQSCSTTARITLSLASVHRWKKAQRNNMLSHHHITPTYVFTWTFCRQLPGGQQADMNMNIWSTKPSVQQPTLKSSKPWLSETSGKSKVCNYRSDSSIFSLNETVLQVSKHYGPLTESWNQVMVRTVHYSMYANSQKWILAFCYATTYKTHPVKIHWAHACMYKV